MYLRYVIEKNYVLLVGVTMKKALLYLITKYQKYISPLKGPTCRFYPSCSQYTYEAIDRYGVFKGSLIAVKRILKCHPFHPGGYDPVK